MFKKLQRLSISNSGKREGREKDESFSFCTQVAIFCEGTRFSQDKFLQGVEYAKTAGLTPLKYHLVPRTKGYAILAQSLKHEGNLLLMRTNHLNNNWVT